MKLGIGFGIRFGFGFGFGGLGEKRKDLVNRREESK